MISAAADATSTRTAYVAFAAFGGLWGVWGAALPAVRDAAGVSEGQLGAALILMASTGVLVAVAAAGRMSLAALLLLLGATSGAADVGINAVAAAAERSSGRPVLTRAHGVFSTAVVVSALVSGGIEAAGLPVAVAFGLVVAAALLAASSLWPIRAAAVEDAAGLSAQVTSGVSWGLPLVVIGSVGALAFAVENVHQSWSAVFLADVLAVPGGLTAAAPAVFAGVAAATRFATGASGRLPAGPLLTAGALTAAAGTLLLARSSTPVTALAGLALTASGTSVLYPTLLREALGGVRAEVRGRTTSVVATTSYLGFAAGPVFVGALADAAGLRNAMTGVAALAAVTAVLAWPVARWGGRAVTRRTERSAHPVS